MKTRNLILSSLVILVLGLSPTLAFSAPNHPIQDKYGRTTGYYRKEQGQVKFFSNLGHLKGTAVKQHNGKYRMKDHYGRTQGYYGGDIFGTDQLRSILYGR